MLVMVAMVFASLAVLHLADRQCRRETGKGLYDE